jgi:hypothetical protein
MKRIGLTPTEKEQELIEKAMEKAKQKKVAPFLLALALERIEERWPELFQSTH